MNYFHQLLRASRPGWSVMVGSETLMAEAVLFGADGGVCGGANIVSALFVELFEEIAKDQVVLLCQFALAGPHQGRLLKLESHRVTNGSV